jgi:hypothetical protein
MDNKLCLNCLTFIIPLYRINGIHYEEYCPNCNKYIKWISKEEVDRLSLKINNDDNKIKPLF